MSENKGVASITNKEIFRYGTFLKTYYRSKQKYTNDFAPKIVMKKICYNLECSIDLVGEINPINTVYVVKPLTEDISLKTLLAILNSKLLSFYARKKYASTAMRGGYIELRVFEIATLPIAQPKTKMQSELDKLVEQLLRLNKEKRKQNLKVK